MKLEKSNDEHLDTPKTDEIATFRPNDDGKTDFIPAEFAQRQSSAASTR